MGTELLVANLPGEGGLRPTTLCHTADLKIKKIYNYKQAKPKCSDPELQ
jgi:hypothetical protein